MCTSCKQALPATAEYFSKYSERGGYKPGGLRSQCKKCTNAKDVQREQEKKQDPNYVSYYEKHRVKWLVENMNHRAESGATYVDVENMLDAAKDSNGILYCVYCNRPITDHRKLHLDHFLPLKHGGTNNIENIVPACRYCNRSKWDDDPLVWYRDQIFFNAKTEAALLLKYHEIKLT